MTELYLKGTAMLSVYKKSAKLLGVCAASAALLTSMATSAAIASAVEKGGPYCAAFVEKAPEGEASPIVAEACSNVSPSEAKDKLDDQLASEVGPQSVSASWRLATVYSNAGFQGSTDSYYGAEECDYSGYRIALSSWWQNNVSSIQGGGRCNTAYLLNISQSYAETRSLPQQSLGTFNDNVSQFQVFYR